MPQPLQDSLNQAPNSGYYANQSSNDSKSTGAFFIDVLIEQGRIDSYLIQAQLSGPQKEHLTTSLGGEINNSWPSFTKGAKWITVVSWLPGVTDAQGNVVRQIIEDQIKRQLTENEGVYYSSIKFGNFSSSQEVPIPLYNNMVQKLEVIRDLNSPRSHVVPLVKAQASDWENLAVDLNVSDQELEKMSKYGINGSGPLNLSLEAMRTIRAKSAKSTIIELETLALTWSEHCKHTIFAAKIDEVDGLFKTYIRGSALKINHPDAVSLFTDNAGGVRLNDDWVIVAKAETHNSPSALEPFGGSMTGVLGCNRDIIGYGLGAMPVANFYTFGASRGDRQLYRDKDLKVPALSGQNVEEGMIRGVKEAGNCSGIPTTLGHSYFSDDFSGKPFIFAASLGVIPKLVAQKPSHLKCPQPGDYIVIIGGRTGIDGIHGATASSGAIDSSTPATMVQIGDPVTQRNIIDALIDEIRDLGLYNAITDNGAGGLCSSVGEMGFKGFIVYLDRVKLKYPGMASWQIWISESQERMTLAVPPTNYSKLVDLLKKYAVESQCIGEFNSSGRAVLMNKQEVLMDLSTDFLHNGLPQLHLTSKQDENFQPDLPKYQQKSLKEEVSLLLKSPNIFNDNRVAKQYDYEVQGGSVLKPIQGKGGVCAEVVALMPLYSKGCSTTVVASHFLGVTKGDAYVMAAGAIDRTIASIIAAGGDLKRLFLLDNFCWSSSFDPNRLFQLKEAARACYDCSIAYGTPFISGKDSMFNDFYGYDAQGIEVKISAPPSLLITGFSIIEDPLRVISIDAKFAGDLIYLIGDTHEGLLGSEYQKLTGFKSGIEPPVDVKTNKETYLKFQGLPCNIISSAIAIKRGGLVAALYKKLGAGGFGGDIKLTAENLSAHLFSESCGRILVTIDPNKQKIFEDSIDATFLGRVTDGSELVINDQACVTLG